jgi:hypothetical protein
MDRRTKLETLEGLRCRLSELGADPASWTTRWR